MMPQHEHHQDYCVDRYEEMWDGEWFCLEFLCITCPVCGNQTDLIISEPDKTEYLHKVWATEGAVGVRSCFTHCTAEPLPEPFMVLSNLLLLPEDIRNQLPK